MSATLRRRLEVLEQQTGPEGYWSMPLGFFYGEDVAPVWMDGTTRRGLDDFYADLNKATQTKGVTNDSTIEAATHRRG